MGAQRSAKQKADGLEVAKRSRDLGKKTWLNKSNQAQTFILYVKNALGGDFPRSCTPLADFRYSMVKKLDSIYFVPNIYPNFERDYCGISRRSSTRDRSQS